MAQSTSSKGTETAHSRIPNVVFNFPNFVFSGFTAGDFQGNGKLDFAGGQSNGDDIYTTLVYTLLQGSLSAGSASPSSLTYAAQAPATSSAAQKVTLSNGGPAPLKITSIGFTGSDPNDFGQSNTCGSSVPAYSDCRISVTFTPTGAGNRSATLSIADNSVVGSPQTVSLTGTGEDFSLAASPTSSTVTPGQAANYTVTVSPMNGFAQSVSFSCSGAPAGATCSVTPSQVTLNGSNSANVAVAVVTAGTGMGQMQPFNGRSTGSMLALWLALSGVFGMVMLPRFGPRRGPSRSCVFYGIMLVGVVSLLLMILACGGGNGGSTTPTGTYQLTVTGTYTSGSATLTHNVQLTLVVQ
jgi:uncharacterized protein